MTQEMKVVAGVGIITALLVGSVIIFAFRNSADTPSTARAVPATDLKDAGKLIRDDSYTTGDANAKVTIVEFGDYQCPACAASATVIRDLVKSYSGKGVGLVFRNFPLDQLHANAQISATAAEAAGAQGKYWEMYDKLYSTQQEWTADPPASKTVNEAINLFVGYAKDLGLDTTKFKKDLDTRAYNAILSRDLADANALKLQGTPSLFVNGKAVANANELKAAVDAALAQ